MYDIDTNETPSISSGDSEYTKKDLEEFMLLATQQAKFQAQTHVFNETCWDLCVDKPGAKLDNKTSTCLSNCVDRFVDVTLYITNRYFNMLQRSANRM